jgi:hypothetical protein
LKVGGHELPVAGCGDPYMRRCHPIRK